MTTNEPEQHLGHTHLDARAATAKQEWPDRIEAAAADVYRVLGLAWSPDNDENAVTWLGSMSSVCLCPS